ncbi:cobalamin-dependent protein [Actinomadura sp. ATCC 31491]|uniref:Cobalamin-dependent protein n=1 Tax=Actinomadura luzonensis TaxID=2805427 RepID=A0ABT0FIV8_9ACTN|nr:cobalamin-dependent protein [Actinomadura luzonensis]MCK2212242.1 cobalamin-dependent protein [Actinomadura luzonensis]
MADDYADLVDRMWAAAMDGDDHGASDVALAALDAGLPVEDLLLGVLAGVQARVGDAWEANLATVAQEHLVTGVSERVLAAAVRHPAARARHTGERGRVAVACVAGEWHAFPARLLAELLRLDGWRVAYLGPHVPAAYLRIHAHEAEADVVTLSASLPTRLPAAYEAIAACREAGRPVLAGGAAFGADGRYARLLGADGWAPDGRAAARLLAAGPPVTGPAEGERAGGEPAGKAYERVRATAEELAGAVMWKLGERIPELAAYSQKQLQHTKEDIGYIIDFLAMSLYVRDPELFARFLRWTAGVLSARGVPAATLLPALDLLAGQLGDVPQALATLEYGRRALAG